MKILTIGIPTYNRKKIVQKNVQHILSDNFINKNNIDLIVSDNNSNDGSFELLKNIQAKKKNYLKNFFIKKNKINLGVFKNIFNIFKTCKSRYLMITSDEEFIKKENVIKLINFLKKKKPTFVSTQFFHHNKLYRGSRLTKKIEPNQWIESSFFTSGLVFDVKATNLIIKKYIKLLTKENLFYVQSLLVAELTMAKPHTQWYFNYQTTEKKYNIKTTISRNKKYPYWTVVGRWNSFLAIENYFKKRTSISGSNKLIKMFIKNNREDLYRKLIIGIDTIKPEMLMDFRVGMLKYEFRPFSWLFLKIMLIKTAIFKLLKNL